MVTVLELGGYTICQIIISVQDWFDLPSQFQFLGRNTILTIPETFSTTSFLGFFFARKNVVDGLHICMMMIAGNSVNAGIASKFLVYYFARSVVDSIPSRNNSFFSALSTETLSKTSSRKKARAKCP